MRHSILALLILLGSAASFGQEASLEKEVTEFLEAVGKAFDARDGEEIVAHFDLPRFWREMKAWGDPPARSPQEEASAFEEIKAKLGAKLEAESGVYRFEELRVLGIDPREDRTAVVMTRETDHFGLVARRRWWLRRGEAGWLIVDTEDTGLGFRLSLLAAESFPGLVAKEGSPAAAALLALSRIRLQVALGAHEKAEASLADLPDDLPAPLSGIRHLLRGSIHLVMERDEEALDELSRAAAALPDPPLIDLYRAVARNRTGLFESALKHAERFVERSGGDPDGHREKGIALRGLGRPMEALAAFRKGLAEDADSPVTLVELATVLPSDALTELSAGFAKLANPRGEFEDMVTELIEREKRAAAVVLVAALRKVAPKDPNADYYGARLLADEGKYEAAATLLLRAIPNVADPEERDAYEQAFLDAMIAAKKPLEAYADRAGSGPAFGYLADHLAREEDGPGLLALVKAHREHAPDEVWLLYYTGLAREFLDQREEAEKAYAEGLTKAEDAETRNEFRAARVWNLYTMGKGMDAYERIQPRRSTFRQLAMHYADAGDPVGLAALVAAHRKRDSGDPDIYLFAAEVLWLNRDYTRMVELLLAKREDLATEKNTWRFADRLVRGLLRTEQTDEALAEAVALREKHGEPWYEAVVNAVRGDVEATAKALAACVEMGYDPATFYEDEDLGPALRKDAMKAMRDKYPPN